MSSSSTVPPPPPAAAIAALGSGAGLAVDPSLSRRPKMALSFRVRLGSLLSGALLRRGSARFQSSFIWPAFGVHPAEFQAAIENGGQFTADSTILLIHIVLGSIVSVMSGFLAALVAGESKRAPLVLGFLLLAVGLLKMVMSWPYVPIWYHVLFTALLIPMAIIGGKLKTGRR